MKFVEQGALKLKTFQMTKIQILRNTLILTLRAAIFCLRPSMRIDTLIDQICASDYLERFTSPLLQMLLLLNPQQIVKLFVLFDNLND